MKQIRKMQTAAGGPLNYDYSVQSDNTRVFSPYVVQPFTKKQWEQEQLRRNLKRRRQTVVTSDNRSTWQKQQDQKKAKKVQQQEQEVKNQEAAMKAASGLMAMAAPTTYIKLATNPSAKTVTGSHTGDFLLDAGLLGGPSLLRSGLRYATPVRAFRLSRELNNNIQKLTLNLKSPLNTTIDVRDNITLYRANASKPKGISKGESYGDTTGRYVGKWFTEDPQKPHWYASNYAKRGEEPMYYQTTVPKYWAEQQRASRQISNSNIEFEPEDFILEDGIHNLQGQLYNGRPGTLSYLQQTFKFPKLQEPSTSLKFFERKPSRISLAERLGIPKGERNQSNIISKFGEPFTYDETGLFIPNPNYNFRNGWGLIEDAIKTGRIRVPEGDYKSAVLKKYPFLNKSIGPFSTVRDLSFKFPYFQRGESIWPFKTQVQAEDLIAIPNDLPGVSWNKVSKFNTIFEDEIANIGDKTTPIINGKSNIFPSNKALFFRLNKTTNKYEPYEIIPTSEGWGVYSNKYNKGFSTSYFEYPNYIDEPINIKKKKQGGKMNILQFLKNGSGIHIKKENRGKFTDYCGGKVTSSCIAKGKASSDPAVRKRATFAANARKWKHKKGGAFVKGVNVLDSNPKAYKEVKKKYKMRSAQQGGNTADWKSTAMKYGANLMQSFIQKQMQNKSYDSNQQTSLASVEARQAQEGEQEYLRGVMFGQQLLNSNIDPENKNALGGVFGKTFPEQMGQMFLSWNKEKNKKELESIKQYYQTLKDQNNTNFWLGQTQQGIGLLANYYMNKNSSPSTTTTDVSSPTLNLHNEYDNNLA